MLQGKRTRKVIAATMLAVFLSNTLAPLASYALTSGPTQPEATSFEPIDTTDMVGLQTGDFTYNVPLLEVPGPEGGYPLSLSYHAGIQPNEDASWVGLGWTLNPGAINRSVNGYPDDWQNPANSSHVYWAGGVTKTWNVGVSVGIAGVAGVSFGLAFSQDTYRGFGVGFSVGVSLGIGGDKSPFGIGIGMGVSPYGDSYVYGGFTVGTPGEGINASIGVGFTTNFESLNMGVSGGIGYNVGIKGTNISGQGSLLGASISTGGGKPSLEVGGLSASVSGTKAAGIQTSTSGWQVSLPFVSFGKSKTRYWTNETNATVTRGSLYTPGGFTSVADDNAYDTYSLLEDPETKNIVDNPDPTKLQGGAYLDFDLYSVSAQGLGGNIRPYLFQGQVPGQNRKDQNNNPLLNYYLPGFANLTPQFRFVGDFSNSYRQDYPFYPTNAANQNLTPMIPPNDSNPLFGNSDANYDGTTGDYDGTYGYSYSTNKLAGSRHINIGVTVQPSNIRGYVKTDRYKNGMIEGFSITNESGVTYHYGLPAYSWDEENYQERISQTNGYYFNRQKKLEAYAYTWYLTTITGPDFVDRDGDGRAGSNDWGYWINFEYGKWSNYYVWRNPSEGYQRDEDNEWQTSSVGKREVYYLNAIRTRSHLAIFEKEVRTDAKGASPEVYYKNTVNSVDHWEGSPTPHPVMRTDELSYKNTGIYNTNSSQSLKLSRIYLLDIANANAVNTNYGRENYGRPETLAPFYTPRSIPNSCENAHNVIDKTDIDTIGRLNFEAKAIRIIDFNYDYSLCTGTANSFPIGLSGGPLSVIGKLALKSVLMRGKGGVSLLPPTRFEYELAGTDVKSQSGVTLSATSFVTTNGNFAVGDLIVKDDPLPLYCGVITKKQLSGGNYTYTLLNSRYLGGTATANIRTTKNPWYNKDAYDSWGMYKSDFSNSIAQSNENQGRITTPISAQSVDVWSLRKITSSLGGEIKINYESDQFITSTWNSSYPFKINSINPETNGTYPYIPPSLQQVKFKIETNGYDINNIAHVNDVGRAVVEVKYYDVNLPPPIYKIKEIEFKILSIDSDGTIHASLSSPVQATYTDQGIIFYFIGYKQIGNVSMPNISGICGGGIRVKNVTIEDLSGYSSITSYNYNNPSDDDISSGVTSYLPTVFDDYDRSLASLEYKKKLYSKVNELLAISREIPPPSVMYEYVTVINSSKNVNESIVRTIEGKTQYQFEIFRNNMISRKTLNNQQGVYSSIPQSARSLAIKKFTSSIGNVKRVIQYDNKGVKLSETINNYLHDGLESLSPEDFMTQYKTRLAQYKYQGYLQERYSEVKRIQNSSADNGVKSTLSAREEYPCIQIGQTIINYANGIQIKSENLGFDFYSGAVTKTVETDAYGNRFMTEVIPAYRKYPEMGLKLSDQSNENMLTQIAGTYVYKVNGSNAKMGLVSAQVQVWTDGLGVTDIPGGGGYQNGGILGNVWRHQSSYIWMPVNKTSDGLTAMGDFADLNWSNPGSSNVNWKKTYEAIRYSVFSKPLETIDMNGIRSAVKLDYNHKKVIYKVSNAAYYEIAYSGAEGNESLSSGLFSVMGWNGVATTEAAHTGARSLKLGTGGKKGFLVDCSNALTSYQTGKSFSVSVWVKPVTGTVSDVKLYYEVNGVEKGTSSSASSTKTANGWTLVTLTIPGSDLPNTDTFVKIGCRNDHSTIEVYLDDFRLQPVASMATAYIYDPFSGELTYTLDNNNLYTKFEYDGAGRLVKTYREKLGMTTPMLVNENQYNYGVTKYLSQPIDADFVKNNCPSTSQAGSTVHITLPEGQRISFESQTDANTQGQEYAQNKANNEGICNWLPGTYVRIDIVPNNPPTTTSCLYQQTATVTLRFFSDHACTTPLNVTNLPVNLVFYHESEAGFSTTNSTISCTGTSKVVTATMLYEYWNDCANTYTFDYYDLISGTGYVNVN